MLQLEIKNIGKIYFKRAINKNKNWLILWHSSCINKVLVEKFTGFEVFLEESHLKVIRIEN